MLAILMYMCYMCMRVWLVCVYVYESVSFASVFVYATDLRGK